MKKVIFKIKADNKILEQAYDIEFIKEYFFEKVYEDLCEDYGCDGSCTNESVNHCECNPPFEEKDVKILDIQTE